MHMNWKKYNPPENTIQLLEECRSLTIVSSTEELLDLSCGGPHQQYFEVAYDVPGHGKIIEATVSRARNGIAVNYPEAYMRRRDPDSMVISDALPTNKPTFSARFGYEFSQLREATFAWLKTQPLAMFGFIAGQKGMGGDSLAIIPANTGFFGLALAYLQGIIAYSDIPDNFHPTSVIYVAPPFRHTHFNGKQVVVHQRDEALHELFSYNLYPGPSAKKGIYGVLIGQGEREGWITAHCSTVQVITPYDNHVVIMHEGASGGGKSEMLEVMHREEDGRIVLGTNTLNNEMLHLEIPRSCQLQPVTDDMALCHPSLQSNTRKLSVTDAEDAWFVRINHLTTYGTDPHLEKLTIQPPAPLVFLNIDNVPGGRALIWDHIQDAPGKPCPNPRVIIPRRIMPDIIERPVSVDIRSFGVRTPPCTSENPTYGILGMFHLLPGALAWLWRLVAPRGHDNPSIVDSDGMTSEGVGSYWPFATGRRVDQANLLLKQFQQYTDTRYILCPNQYIGAWKVGFMPQWITREYLARRGIAPFRAEQIVPSRCSLLGYTLRQLQVEGRMVPRWLLRVETQPEVGEAAYDRGAAQLTAFFRKCLADFCEPGLDPLGRQIIECCCDGGSLQEYERLIPTEY